MTADTSNLLHGAEAWLIAGLRRRADRARSLDGWVYSTLDALLLDVGRLFTPAPWPSDDGAPPGDLGALLCGFALPGSGLRGALAYVEGWAADWADFDHIAHAWCADPEGHALDPAWPRPGMAYLGLSVRAEPARALMAERFGPLLHGADGSISPLAEQWMREGVPGDILADVGRHVPKA
ncbi:hypothetical protein ACFVUW_10830 [Streptomyces xiamenensis]|uniref:hypothetical protein n=1 Tax=Streptomyces xiamenensis TaxID=408015 RepID=UPI0036E6FC23